MDEIVKKALLFDFYGELLTDHQKEVYGEYIQNDLSATEIAELRGISRQGVHDMVRRCEKILGDYEERLHLVEHYLKIKKMVGEIHQCAADILASDDREDIGMQLQKIQNISSEILEQY